MDPIFDPGFLRFLILDSSARFRGGIIEKIKVEGRERFKFTYAYVAYSYTLAMLPRRYYYVVTLSSGSLRFLRNARVTRGYDFRSRQKRPVPLARCVSRYVRRKTRRIRARAWICAPCDNRTFRNDAFPACTFRYFPQRRRRRRCLRRDDAPPVPVAKDSFPIPE